MHPKSTRAQEPKMTNDNDNKEEQQLQLQLQFQRGTPSSSAVLILNGTYSAQAQLGEISDDRSSDIHILKNDEYDCSLNNNIRMNDDTDITDNNNMNDELLTSTTPALASTSSGSSIDIEEYKSKYNHNDNDNNNITIHQAAVAAAGAGEQSKSSTVLLNIRNINDSDIDIDSAQRVTKQPASASASALASAPSTQQHSSCNNNNNNNSLNNRSILSLPPNHNIGSPITPLHNIPYVHGGYAAAAPLFVTHSKFASVLKRLLPGAYQELRGLLHRNDQGGGAGGGGGGSGYGAVDLLSEYSANNDLIEDSSMKSVQHHSIDNRQNQQQQNYDNSNNICITDPVKIMKWAENNPIVSAFGIWNSDNGRRTKRFMQGVVVVKHPPTPHHPQQQQTVEGAGESSGVKDIRLQETTSSTTNEGSPLRKRLKERIDRARYKRDVTPPPPPSALSSTNNNDEITTITTGNDEAAKHDVIDEQHLNSLLQSLSTNYSSSEVSNADDGSFDLSFRDRGNSSVVEAVITHDTTSLNGGGNNGVGRTQQRLLRNYQQQQQQQQQQLRKKEYSNGATNTSSSSSSHHLPPLPPTSQLNSTRNTNSYSRPLSSAPPPPPPPGTTLLKGGGRSGPGGVSSPRRKIPLPSDLPNSTNANTAAATTIEGSNKEGSASRSRSISLTNTSYDAYLNEHRQQQLHQQQHLPYNRQRTSSSSSTTFLDTEQHPQQQPYYNKPAIEWDIFLDPQLVRLVDAALTVVDDLESKLHKIRLKRERVRQQRRKERKERKMKRKRREEMRRRMRMNGGGFGKVRGDDEYYYYDDEGSDDDDDSRSTWNDEEDDQDFDLLQTHTAAQVEVDRLVAQLMRRTIIAHGSMSQLVLEGLGWAPEYNFGRVVKCSREGTNLPSPQRRNGGHRHQKQDYLSASMSFSDTLSWDEEEEQRDFEALLDRRIHSSSAAGTSGRGSGGAANTGSKSGGSSSSSGTHHSKGMFMEKWLSLFAKSLSLLVRSTNSSSSGGDAVGGDGNGIVKSSSSSSFVPLEKKKKDAEAQLAKIKRKKKKSVTKKPEDRGLTCYLSSLFFGSDKSSTIDSDDDKEEDSDNDKEHDNNDDDDDNSAHLTNNDMFSPAIKIPKSGILGGLGCGMSLCLGMDDDEVRFTCGASTSQTSNSVFPLNPHASHQMARDIQRIHDVLGEPLRLVLDLKSRRVPPRVWSRLIDNLRSRGLLIEGIGSFDVDELRVIGKGCSYPLTPILFFHSVGDLQRACHANEVKKGDTVYFNGGSLMWKRSSIMEAAECGGCFVQVNVDDESDIHTNNGYERTSSTATTATSGARTLNAKGGYSFQPYAYPRSALSDWERVQCKSTIEDYRRHFDLKIGVYVQEFSISADALEELTVFVNQHGDLYDQGIAFGGVNGVAVKNIKGDGYWNQRYMGRSWDFNARPSKEMTPLKPEDHHLVQVAIQAGAWGQVGTIYEVNDEQTGALTVHPPREPCMHIGID